MNITKKRFMQISCPGCKYFSGEALGKKKTEEIKIKKKGKRDEKLKKGKEEKEELFDERRRERKEKVKRPSCKALWCSFLKKDMQNDTV
jgi:hypothetical protein